jgi:hypothetical protein
MPLLHNDPATVSEIRAAFDGYYASLAANDVAAVQDWFIQSETTVRFGMAENLFGASEINAYRAGSIPSSTASSRERVVVTSFGRDFGVTSSLTRPRPGRVGRTTQAWVRTDAGWKIAAAHVSAIDDRG